MHRSVAVLWSSAVPVAAGVLRGWASPPLFCVAALSTDETSEEKTSVIGVVSLFPPSGSVDVAHAKDVSRPASACVWLTIRIEQRRPVLSRIYMLGKESASISADFFFFDPPDLAMHHIFALDHGHFTGPAAVSSMPVTHRWLSPNSLCVVDFDYAKITEWINLSAHKHIEIQSAERSCRLLFRNSMQWILSLIHFWITRILFILYAIRQHMLPRSSSFIQQSLLRAEMLCAWQKQYANAYNSTDITAARASYLNFYNTLWLVSNDLILGITLGSILIHNTHHVTNITLWLANQYTLENVRDPIIWLMSWPAGLKLNQPLASFYGNLFLWILDSWAAVMSYLSMYIPKVLFFLGLLSHFGLSVTLSFISDALSLATFHFHLFYTLSARTYNWQTSIMLSLFYLFQGKKWNILRKRLDTCDYAIDQLLLGTILFTLVLFLLPTNAMYYFYFASVRLALVLVQTCLETILAILNNFPLFIVMLRIKDPQRLPGGIKILRLKSQFKNTSEAYCTYFTIHSQPVSLNVVFAQYFRLLGQVQQQVFSVNVIKSFITGVPLRPMDRFEVGIWSV